MVTISSYDLRNFTGFCIKVNALIQYTQEHIYNYQNVDIKYDVPELNCVYDINPPTENILYCGVNNNSSNSGVVIDVEQVKLKSIVFNNIFKIKDAGELNQLANCLITSNTLAIHLRGTDKDSEVPKVEDSKIISYIQSFLIEHPDVDKIFIATDDEHYRKLILNNFDNVIFNDCIRSSDGSPIHLYSKYPSDLLYREVLRDCYIISKCKYFMYCFSNVSFLAMIMGIDTFSEVQCINS